MQSAQSYDSAGRHNAKQPETNPTTNLNPTPLCQTSPHTSSTPSSSALSSEPPSSPSSTMSTSARNIEIRLPLPASQLSPNSRAHWRKVAAAKKQAKNIAYLRTLAAVRSLPPGSPASFTSYRLDFYFRTNRNRDDDNAKASCKAFRDGVALALKVDDSTLKDRYEATLNVRPSDPHLILTLYP